MRTTPEAGVTIDITNVLTLTDMACVKGTTTITSVLGVFTPAMTGMILKITGGTNLVPGYYPGVSYVDAHTITITDDPLVAGNGSNGTGQVGAIPTTPQIVLPVDASHPRCENLRITSDDTACFWSIDGGVTYHAYRDGSLAFVTPVALELPDLGLRGDDTVSVKVSDAPKVVHCEAW